MQRFIKKIILFVLAFLVLITGIQVFVSCHIKNKSITGHDNLVQTSGVHADLVFLGSSRCTAHFDPVFFDSTYHIKSVNIGVDGHSELSMATLRLKTYLLTNKAPKFAILSFDPLVSSGHALANTNLVHKNDFARYAFLPGKTESGIVNYFKFDLFERYIPLYALVKYQLAAPCWSAGSKKYSTDWYDKHASPSELAYSTVTDSIKEKYPLPKDVEGVKNALTDLRELCRVNNIKLYCIQTPVYSVIYDKQAFSLASKICSDLSIPFIDINGLTNISQSKENFYNADHMNINGVIQMNAWLKANLPQL